MAEHRHEAPTFIDLEGKERSLTENDLDQIFERFYGDPQGRTPVVASRRLEGKPLGPFRYYGTRSDDPNDIFEHENRRELRGLRVFASWLNHDDSRSINTLDVYQGEPGQGFVRHYLIDFGSCLGSGSVKMQGKRAGNEYIYEGRPALKAGLTLGIWDRPWRHVKYPRHPAVGRFEAEFFQPEHWKPEYPNPAFERMQPEDSFWATRIVMRFTDEMIRALVKTGRLPDPAGEEYLVRTLIRRRDKVVHYYLGLINPLSQFELREGSLVFSNLGLDAGLVELASYRYQWHRFDNNSGLLQPLGEERFSQTPKVEFPDDGSPYLMVRVHTLSIGPRAWQRPLEVYVRNSATPQVVGISR